MRIEESTGQDALELFLLRLQYREGRQIPVEGNRPLQLHDPTSVYIVAAGTLDLFAVRGGEDAARGARHHLLRVRSGCIAPGLAFMDDPELSILATGLPNTKVLRVPRATLDGLRADRDFAGVIEAQIDEWIAALTEVVVCTAPPAQVIRLATGAEARAEAGAIVAQEGVLWVRCAVGSAVFASGPSVPSDRYTPLCRGSWLDIAAPCTLEALGTATLLDRAALWPSLDAFHHLALGLFAVQIREDERAARARVEQRAREERATVSRAFSGIAALLAQDQRLPTTPGDGAADMLPAVTRLVGAALGVSIVAPYRSLGATDGASIWSIARASHLRAREVRLQERWYRRDSGPLVGFLATGQRPVALLPRAPGRYEVVNPADGTRTDVTPTVAAKLDERAVMLYRPFPRRAIVLADVLRYALASSRREVATIVLAGLISGVLALAPPILTAYIVDTAIPSADRGRVLAAALVLLVSVIATTLFRLVQSIAVLRFEGKALVQAAVWDRLLALPAPFFRDFSAGDLGLRAQGITAIQQLLTGPVLQSLLAGLFSLLNLGLLFYYSVPLALMGAVLILVLSLITMFAGYQQVRVQRRLLRVQGTISGLLLQLLNGIAKLRIAGAEHHAFGQWAGHYVEQRRLAWQAGAITNWLAVFNVAYRLLSLLVIFAVLIASGAGLSAGSFLAFNAAFAQLMIGSGLVSAGVVQILGIVPIYERARPILRAEPEVTDEQRHPGDLRGGIEVSHVSFRYAPLGPLILKDISLRVEPGEFVALVGPSGSGKSTVLRLLLGLHEPESGAILYDGQDLRTLDRRELRRQVGSVLQSTRLLPGSLLTNIIGASSSLTIDDAWAAARMAGLEADIRQLPMGMFTVVSEGGSTFSGGQCQRLLIARAVAHTPRLLFFDEATSALDNQTQEQVGRNLQGLAATRIVIAHRLSTIAGADRIYVFDGGAIVQAGTYAELMAQPGLFARLAKRQMG